MELHVMGTPDGKMVPESEAISMHPGQATLLRTMDGTWQWFYGYTGIEGIIGQGRPQGYTRLQDAQTQLTKFANALDIQIKEKGLSSVVPLAK